MHRHVIWTTIGIVVAAGCWSQPPIDRDAEIAALRSAAEAYHAAASAKDAQLVVTFYADDATMIPPNADRVEGIEGVRNYRFGFIDTPGVELRFEIIRVEVSSRADMGWTLAIGDVSFTRPDGQPG